MNEGQEKKRKERTHFPIQEHEIKSVDSNSDLDLIDLYILLGTVRQLLERSEISSEVDRDDFRINDETR